MRRRFEAFDARSQIGDSPFERAHAAVELRMREFDHCLRIGGGALDCLFYGSDSALDLLVDRDADSARVSNLFSSRSAVTSKCRRVSA